MTDGYTYQHGAQQGRPRRAISWRRWVPLALGLVLAAVALASILGLERRFDGLDVRAADVGSTPVTLYSLPAAEPQPLVVVAHGFGGSRQMMDQISVTLARAGFAVAAFDFPGHGRNPQPLSRDVTSLDGTTAQLVAVTQEVARAMSARDDIAGPISFVGHSMATDVIIRAAEETPDLGALVAISMYSEAVTPQFPQDLLIVSGASEGHLRAVALEAVRMLQAEAQEGDLVRQGDTSRQAIAAPFVGHVGVLYSETTLDAAADWLSRAVGERWRVESDTSGITAGLLLLALTGLAWPMSRLLPARPQAASNDLPRRQFWMAVGLPVLPAVGVTLLIPATVGPAAGFATLAGFFGIWGGVQLILLRRFGQAFPRVDAWASAALLVWGLAVFALALDRYGAAFLPSGPRVPVMALLALGTVPLMLADAMLLGSASLWRRLVARFAILLALSAAMALNAQDLALTFTVLPVFVLFVLVYGSFARWISERRGAGSAALAQGVCLAWALAASTPLFSTQLLP
ncbi:alpha/beta hydrolase [Primorskyibacter sp. S187A]|uniref:alpha/beta hydrolase n=1 Tax=Primorskyibacter sp. S187A TaxID=3415130 RepID=UPI003C7B6F35